MPDTEPPELVPDPLTDPGATSGSDPDSLRTVKGHQVGRTDAASGGADSSPLENEPTDERPQTPAAERMSTPDRQIPDPDRR